MKKVIIIIVSLFLLGCNASDKKDTGKNETTNINQAEMQKTSSLLISNFMTDLKAELMKGVKDGGFENAINSCQIKAPEIADNFSGAGWSIKRVTDKPRSPQNNANEHELQILALFADSLKKLEFFDEWMIPDSQTNYYYYKPIYIGKFCLKCHGDKGNLDEKAAIALQNKYPDDQATDYQNGDLRGMFVVHIKDANEFVHLQQALNDSL